MGSEKWLLVELYECASAAGGGHLEILVWARENDCPWNYLTCASAAGDGHLKVLVWARENGCEWIFLHVLSC